MWRSCWPSPGRAAASAAGAGAGDGRGAAAAAPEPALLDRRRLRCGRSGSAAVPPVLADPVQFEQVLLNLCLNARDAIGEHGTIRLRIGHAPAWGTAPPAACGWMAAAGWLRGGRRRPRHDAGRGRPDVRALLHDQGDRPRHRHGPGDGAWDRARPRRPHPGEHGAGAGHLPRAAAGRRGHERDGPPGAPARGDDDHPAAARARAAGGGRADGQRLHAGT